LIHCSRWIFQIPKPKVYRPAQGAGFSEYLHPLDQDTLIGFGYNTQLTQGGGWVQDGLKLSLFDIADPACSPRPMCTARAIWAAIPRLFTTTKPSCITPKRA
jgi:uncharacterized secreted protein with C-terminal beta-propeller domain